MHMKELPMFTYNSWMDCLHQDKSCQFFCPVINIAMSNNFKRPPHRRKSSRKAFKRRKKDPHKEENVAKKPLHG